MYCQTYHKEIWNSSPAKKLRRYGNRTPQTAFLTAETLKCYFHLVKRCVSLEGLKLALLNLLSFFFSTETWSFRIFYILLGKIFLQSPRMSISKAILATFFLLFSFLFWKMEGNRKGDMLCSLPLSFCFWSRWQRSRQNWNRSRSELIFTFIIINSDNTSVSIRKWRPHFSLMPFPRDHIIFYCFLFLHYIEL